MQLKSFILSIFITMNQKNYTYQYPHPALTADCILLTPYQNTYKVLLIQRKNDPCKGMWAFPGGFMNIDETIEETAHRELLEETGLKVSNLQQLHLFSTVDRDPRERVITMAFWCVTNHLSPIAGDDAQNAQWFNINERPALAFDHETILQSVLLRLNDLNKRPRITPEYITKLNQGEIFVFGSNLAGAHAGGAARAAVEKFGAIWGQGVGLQGSSYALPTMQGGVETIRPYVDQFITFACQHSEYKFLVTPIGCGIAGFTPKQIAPLFADAKYVSNITLPNSFWQYI